VGEVVCAIIQLVTTAVKWGLPKRYTSSLTSYLDCVMHVTALDNTGADNERQTHRCCICHLTTFNHRQQNVSMLTDGQVGSYVIRSVCLSFCLCAGLLQK